MNLTGCTVTQTALKPTQLPASLRRVVVPIASRAGLGEHYAYLEESLKRFPDGAAQQQLALDAGFRKACHRPVAAGLMGLLTVWA